MGLLTASINAAGHYKAPVCSFKTHRTGCFTPCSRRPVSSNRILQGPRAELASNQPRNPLGERDPTQAEQISGFADKPLGFYDTSHVVRGPDGLIRLVGLSARRCAKDAKVLGEGDINKLRNQTPGWKLLLNDQGQPYLRQEWKVKNFTSGLALLEKIALLAEEEGHHPDLHLQGYNTVAVELSTHSVGGLTDNDFIMAARINAIYVKDLLPKPKPRFWA